MATDCSQPSQIDYMIPSSQLPYDNGANRRYDHKESPSSTLPYDNGANRRSWSRYGHIEPSTRDSMKCKGKTLYNKYWKKSSHVGFIFDHFQCKKWIQKASPFQSQICIDLEWFWSSFRWHFHNRFVGFLALTKICFLMTLQCEINDFGCRKGMKKSLNSKSCSICLLEATF